VTRVVHIRPGAYTDSVSLMLISKEISERPDVDQALVAMATELNLDLLSSMDFDVPDEASPNDMVVAIEASDDAAAIAAVEALDVALARRPTAGGSADNGLPPPPTITAASRRVDADLAMISTPGSVAAVDAADALSAGLDVLLFSDNVSLEHEIALKQLAARTGNLLMGPDCGTAVIDGVGLGFANVVRPGPVGIVAASGTGAQHMLTLLDGVGIGVTHCIGVGGRDLSAAVGGRSTTVALGRLGDDDRVTTIVLVSKPPADEVAAQVTAHAESLGKKVVTCYLGAGRPDITAAAASVAQALGVEWSAPRRWGPTRTRATRGHLRGLFSGGTLCDESMAIAAQSLGVVASNIPLADQPALDTSLASQGHTFIDFGDDRLTVGRAHPMIDSTLRLDRLRVELADDDCGVILMDLVLGHGAHPDPATDLVDTIKDAEKPVVVSVIGTRDDPQGYDDTIRRLVDVGVIVHASNAAATREAISLLPGGSS
jgi:FdrA protein